jgi:N6-L-threonylcarbamoyladenine synthase
VVEDGRLVRASVVASQSDLHARWGGVVPEVASRMHVERALPVVVEALEAASTEASRIDAVAVTNRPGLVGALVVGVACAKALSFAWRVPLCGVHHVAAHLYGAMLADRELRFPFVCLVVSGGHTELILAEGHGRWSVMGRTRDDAAGECLDKSARLLGLPYPGGPAIEELARAGDPGAVVLPRAWLGESLDFSFSGLKTAVARAVKRSPPGIRLEDMAASLQASVIDVLVGKAVAAARRAGVGRVALGGGVAANRALAEVMQRECEEAGLLCSVPPGDLCTDNAAMVAAAAYPRMAEGQCDGLALDALASEPLPLWAGAETGSGGA